MEKDKIDQIFLKSHKYVSRLGIIIILVAGTSNFLSCSMSLLNKFPEFDCINTTSLNKIEKCTQEIFCNASDIKETINKTLSTDNFVLKFELYCSKKDFIRNFQSAYYLGAMIGSFILAPVADKFGRKSTFIFLVILNLFSMLNLIVTFNPYHLMVVFFISGTLNYTKYLCNVITSEFSGGKHVGFAISLANSMFPILGILSGVYFYFINKLLYILLFITLLVALILLLSLIYMVESPKWLITQNKNDELKKALEFIAKFNDDSIEDLEGLVSTNSENVNDTNINENTMMETPTTKGNISALEQENKTDQKETKKFYNYIDVILMKSQRKKLLTMCFLAFTFSISYYGILLGINVITKQSFYYGFFMNFIGEVISLLSSGIISDCFGRKVVMVTSSFLSGALFIIYHFLQKYYLNEIINYSGIVVGVISFCISAGYNIQGILSNEIFPTIIKSSCNGLINIIGKLASVLVPVVLYFGEKFLLLIFGSFLITGGIFAFFIDDKEKVDEENLY